MLSGLPIYDACDFVLYAISEIFILAFMLRNLSCLEHLYNTSTKNVNSKKKNQWHVPQKTLLPTNLTQAYRKLFVLNDQNGLMPKTTLSHCMRANNC